MPSFIPLIDFFMTKSIARRNKNGEKIKSCLTPVLLQKKISGVLVGLHIAAGGLVAVLKILI